LFKKYLFFFLFFKPTYFTYSSSLRVDLLDANELPETDAESEIETEKEA